MPQASKDKDQERDESRFNDTLKRMLKTPPKPHEKADKTHKPDKKKPAEKRA
jgi:hypothetical protein